MSRHGDSVHEAVSRVSRRCGESALGNHHLWYVVADEYVRGGARREVSDENRSAPRGAKRSRVRRSDERDWRGDVQGDRWTRPRTEVREKVGRILVEIRSSHPGRDARVSSKV